MVRGKTFNKTIRFYTEGKREIDREFTLWKAECEKGKFCNMNYKFSDFADIWVRDYLTPTASPLVVRSYLAHLKNWIKPKLGDYKLTEINPLIINQFLAELKRSKTKYSHRENSDLSQETIYKIFAITRTILQMAYMNELIPNNPCSKVRLSFDKPVVGSEEIHYYDDFTYKRVLALLEKEPLEKQLVIEFALKTGLRRSEMFGLSWKDVDLINNKISVQKTRQKVNGVMTILPCKTKSSIRTISIPVSLSEKLKEYRKTTMSNTFVFESVDCDNITAWFRNWQKRKKIPRIKFHDLRHTHATLLLYAGIDIKTISERLGHQNIQTTMNTYTHVIKELDEKASQAIDAL